MTELVPGKESNTVSAACSIRVRGVVQGVGFRPFVYRLARAHALAGWVMNAEEGVEIHLEGAPDGFEAFVHELQIKPPPAAQIAAVEVRTTDLAGLSDVHHSREPPTHDRPSSPDLTRPACVRILPC